MHIDSHQHFWQYTPTEHVWMDDRMGVLKKNFLPGDLQPLLGRIGFDGSVVVQARQNLEETQWLLDLADQHPFIRGVVGWVDLRSPEVTDELKRFSKHAKLVGVRHVVHDEPDDNFMLGEAFQNGIAQLEKFDLAYDLLLFPKHLPVAVSLVENFPDQRFILDHIAKPDIAHQQMSPWKEDLSALAAFPNVACKLSGMATETAWKQWKPEEFYPYIDAVIELFGADRVMIGSDWPVCTLSGEYPSVMNIVIDYLQTFSSDIQERILGRNCTRWYRLPDLNLSNS